jgi:hypothetical protein
LLTSSLSPNTSSSSIPSFLFSRIFKTSEVDCATYRLLRHLPTEVFQFHDQPVYARHVNLLV